MFCIKYVTGKLNIVSKLYSSINPPFNILFMGGSADPEVFFTQNMFMVFLVALLKASFRDATKLFKLVTVAAPPSQ